MDIMARLARELEGPAPEIAQRIRWERRRRQEPAPQIVARILERIGAGAVGVDVGASEGVFTSGMLAVKDGGPVHAFEPNPYQAEVLRKIARRRRRLFVHQIALSDRVGDAEFRVPIVDGQRLRGLGSLGDSVRTISPDIETFTVPIARLDDVLGDSPRVDFIKIDVEGHEDSVLAGAHDVLRRHRPSILVEMEQRHRGNDPRPTMEKLVSEYGLRGFAVFPDGLRPLAEFDLERDQLRYVTGGEDEIMPPGYVNDFVFTRRL